MSEEALRQIEVSLLSAMLKDGLLARDLTKAGFRPDLLPSPEGREVARLVLRVRDAGGDVTQSVEAQIADVGFLEAGAAHLLDLARKTPCPDREQALTYLALLELSESSQRLRLTGAVADEILHGRSADIDAAQRHGRSQEARPPHLLRVHLPDPTTPILGEPQDGQEPGAD